MIYDAFIRPLLFALDPEKAHNAAVTLLKICKEIPFPKEVLSAFFTFSHPSLKLDLMNLHFENPVGLAAGFDKNCELLEILPSFGFGFIEGGTITPQPQKGNLKPRLWRLPEEKALINRLGFNNVGAKTVEKNLQNLKFQPPIGINIGKNKSTPNEKAQGDYQSVLQTLFPYASYFVINVSSPNTPNLRTLQNNLGPLLSAAQETNRALANNNCSSPKPMFVKVSPDCSPADLDKICECCINHQVTGLIATNTTLSREGLGAPTDLEGGLSGKPLEERSTQMIRFLYKNLEKKLILIGVGGIFTAEDAYKKIKAGASLVQIYTGWIYGGPATASKINRGLVELMNKDGIKNIMEAVGVEAK